MDDSATDRKIINRLLTSTGWIESKEVTSGKDLIKVFEKVDPDIIITDIMMPEMDGYEVAKALREKGFEKPIIAISGRSEISERKKISAAGIDAFLLKPVNLQSMLDKIDELMANSRNK